MNLSNAVRDESRPGRVIIEPNGYPAPGVDWRLAMQVSPSVRAVQVPDDNPMHPVFTSIYLIGKNGGGEALTIDSGEAVDRYRWMLRGYLAATERAEIALAGITHFHLDHSGNLKWM